MEKLGIYIHIPFCKQKCKYCDFVSFNCDEKIQSKYIECMIKEIKEKKFGVWNTKANSETISDLKENDIIQQFVNSNAKFKNRKITTIYIGGGTPSYIDSQEIIKILETIKENFILDENAEITIEVNPGTVNEKKLIDYKTAGINRISIGLQSTKNRILNFIGRIHTYEDFLDTYNLVKKVGFTNINVDLMLAIPTQTEKELIESVTDIINLNPQHISLYSLILEDGTPLEKMVSKGEVNLLNEDTERKMYWKTKKVLEKNGYMQYEISNFSKKGYESKHNTDCWNQEEYIGFGLAAHSYLNSKRFSNIDVLEEYIKNIENNEIQKNIEVHEEQTREEKAKEYMMLGLRKINGVSISAFERKFRIHPLVYFRFEIEKLVNEKLIEVDLDYIKLTKKGLDFANIVFENFI